MSSSLPIIDENDATPLRQLLRLHALESVDRLSPTFWSYKLLCQIFTQKRILAELKAKNATNYLDFIRQGGSQPYSSSAQTYIRIFALLVYYDRVSDIGMFIKEKVSDQNLPIRRDLAMGKEKIAFCRRDTPGQHLTCFKNWKYHELEGFESTQWRVLIPYFELDVDNRAQHQHFDRQTILPWCKNDGHFHPSSQSSVQEGGFSSVSRINIDPSSHGFSGVLKKIGLKDDFFALKILHNQDFNNEKRFQHEVKQLNRFNGLIHGHLVTLLATFTLDKRYYFIFPYADCTLEEYWESEKTPKLDLSTIRWVSKQCWGIMAAIDCIHNPKHLKDSPVRRYGRHGDIKPDNILWFQSSNDPRGILIVSDMGLSSLNRETSRSNIPNTKIPKVPGYRPPECDIEGGTISRAYDIWTLGCLYLELFTWLLGGWKLLEQFQTERKSVYITGAINDIFFDLKKSAGRNKYVAQVKVQVTEWFRKLHNNKHCSQFIHDALDVIERHMLIVLTKDRKRASSEDLRKKFEELYSKCMDDRRPRYCLEGIPRQ